MRIRRRTMVPAVALALSACDPIPSGRLTLSPVPVARAVATDSIEAVVTRVLAQHGLARDAAPCFRSGVRFAGEVPETLPHGAAPVTLRACLTRTRRGAEVHLTAVGAGIGSGLPPHSQSILAALADSLRPLATVRVGRR